MRVFFFQCKGRLELESTNLRGAKLKGDMRGRFFTHMVVIIWNELPVVVEADTIAVINGLWITKTLRDLGQMRANGGGGLKGPIFVLHNHMMMPCVTGFSKALLSNLSFQMMQGLQLNTPPPIMSACVAPTNVQPTAPSPIPPSLNGCQGQSRPVSKAEHDAISTLLELKQCTQLDCAMAESPKCPAKSKGIHQAETVCLSDDSGAPGIQGGNGTEQKHLSLPNDSGSPSLKSHHDTELYTIYPETLPECEYTPPQSSSDCNGVSRLNSTSSGTEFKVFDPVRLTDILPAVTQEIEVGSCDFLI